jgi:hypothetical protein
VRGARSHPSFNIRQRICRAAMAGLLTMIQTLWEAVTPHRSPLRLFSRRDHLSINNSIAQIGVPEEAFTTGCLDRQASFVGPLG